jgi:hypothetical protein
MTTENNIHSHTPDYTRAKEARAAIEKIYIEMRHFFNRGFYKPFGVSGKEMNDALLILRPEIYGSINDAKKVELNGLVYVIDRLPKGIEECRFIKFISEEGYANAGFERFIPPKRKRNCYRIDEEQFCIEVTRGRSELYDVLTHLTFLYIEAEKIKRSAFDEKGRVTREWTIIEQIAKENKELKGKDLEKAIIYLSSIVGRTFDDTKRAYLRLNENCPTHNNGLFRIVYHLGRVAIAEENEQKFRSISFTPTLRERIGQHIYGEKWALAIKEKIFSLNLIDRPLHIISANMHSVMNAIFAYPALQNSVGERKKIELSKPTNAHLQNKVTEYAFKHGMVLLEDESSTNLNVQIFDTEKIDFTKLSPEIKYDLAYLKEKKPIIVVMDYAFGEQAYEIMDELLKAFVTKQNRYKMNVASINIMGKAGILVGNKGDIMIPDSHVFEGTADNYPFENQLKLEDFEGCGIPTFRGTMITVLGTSLQNREILNYFKNTSWGAIGLEMEGAHYQKAIQAASMIRKNISREVKLGYAYYASDNPLETGSTLASGSLGALGVKPTYIITLVILNKIMNGKM